MLIAGHCHSLKEKRSVVRKLKDRTGARFNLAITEVGGQDTWQRAVLGFALVGNDRAFVATTMERVVRFIEGMGVAELARDEREILNYGDESIGSRELDRDDNWMPAEWTEDEVS